MLKIKIGTVGGLLGLSLLCLWLTGCAQDSALDKVSFQQEDEVALIPVEHFFNEQAVSGLKGSKDGQWLAFFKEYQGSKNIYLMQTGGGLDTALPITTSKDPISEFYWSTQANELFFLKDSEGNENTQLYQLTFNEDKTQPQVSISQVVIPQVTITALTDNKQARYDFIGQIKDKPDTLVVMSNQNNAERSDLYHLNVNTQKISAIFSNDYGLLGVEVNNEGLPVVGVGANPNNTSTLYIQTGDTWQALFTTQFGELVELYGFDEKNGLAYISANIDGRDKMQLIRVALDTGKLTTLHQDPLNESDVYDVTFNENGVPVAVSYYGGRLRTYPLNKEFAHHWDNINGYFKRDVEISISSLDETTGLWQLNVGSDVEMGSDYRYNANTQKVSVLLVTEPTIAPELLSQRQSITYQARDGVTIQAYLTLPKGKSQQLPTIILPHGGPWSRDYWRLSSGYFHPVAQLLANRGYVVLQPNFRASTGFGKHFFNLGNKSWGTGGMQDDLTDGVQFLIDKGIADKQRVGIMGGSYGGYAALAGITFTPDLYQAAVSYVGPSSLITLLESFPERFRPYLGRFYNAVGDPQVEADRKDMQARSPIEFVERIKTPLLLVQGANDPRVTQQESDNIAKVMFKQSLPVEYILAKDEGHGFSKRQNKLAYIVAMEQFFAKHLGGRADNNATSTISAHLDTLKVDVSRL
ncbi:S9 family peptidase [Shewanella surugensis]|uniref:S9 family peptidase n=1 Tax=Shewanella surugensis TaxID=212020 RepID=A0ABT0LEH2_9GAMM|nr:S9 family peptidase [Shewanella surugensis]MCL1125556.1 S9 family peptidase [Shewanella surugensis]